MDKQAELTQELFKQSARFWRTFGTSDVASLGSDDNRTDHMALMEKKLVWL